MPNWNQLKAYMQNPGVAASELKHRYDGVVKDTDDDLKQKSVEDAQMWNKQAPNMNVDPMAMYNTMESAQGLGNVAGVTGGVNPTAQVALEKLIEQANKGHFTTSTDAALFNKVTGKIVPVENATTTSQNFAQLKKTRGY